MSAVIGARAPLTYLWMLHASLSLSLTPLSLKVAGWGLWPCLEWRDSFSGCWWIHEREKVVRSCRSGEKTQDGATFLCTLASLCVCVSVCVWFFTHFFPPRLVWTHHQHCLGFHCAWVLKQTSTFPPDCNIYYHTNHVSHLVFFPSSNLHSALRAPRACWRESSAPLIFTTCAFPGPQRPPRWARRVPARPCRLQNPRPRSVARGSPPFRLWWWWPLARSPPSAEATRGTRCTPLTRPSAWLLPPRRWAGRASSWRTPPRSASHHCLWGRPKTDTGLARFLNAPSASQGRSSSRWWTTVCFENPKNITAELLELYLWVCVCVVLCVFTPSVSFKMEVNLSKDWKHKVKNIFGHPFL